GAYPSTGEGERGSGTLGVAAAVIESRDGHAHTVPRPAAGVHRGPGEPPALATPPSRTIRPAPALRGCGGAYDGGVQGAKGEPRHTLAEAMPTRPQSRRCWGSRRKSGRIWRPSCRGSRPGKPQG